MSVRLEFGPTLPEIAQRRYNIRPAVTVAVVVALCLAAGLLALLVRFGVTDPKAHLVHRAKPVYNLLYPAAVHRAKPLAGELTRLTAKRADTQFAVVVRPLHLPAYKGVVGGVLPLYAEQRLAELRRQPGFQLQSEGKARVNDAPGYQIAYRVGDTVALDVLAVPGDEDRDGVIVSFRQTGPLPLDPNELALKAKVKKTFRSFRFGTTRKY